MKSFNKLLILILLLTALTASLLMAASAAAPSAYGAGKVAVSALNVRQEPGTNGAVLATLSKGDTVVILEKSGDAWYHINFNGTDGYVAAMYITDVGTVKNFNAAGILAGEDIRMRSAPSASDPVLGTYQAGTVMSIIGINNGWYKVQYNGLTGYIRSDFMTLTAESAVASAFSAASTEGQEIAEFARQYVGYKYIYGSASPKSGGFDCSGLTYYVFKQFGYAISRTASQQYKNNGISISKEDLQPGDLVFFSRNGGRSVTHVGLYYGDGMFVNASTESTGVILSSLDSSWYTKTWYGAKRIIG
jgi:uncharacterized protein YgiM (DUF1202 family)